MALSLTCILCTMMYQRNLMVISCSLHGYFMSYTPLFFNLYGFIYIAMCLNIIGHHAVLLFAKVYKGEIKSQKKPVIPNKIFHGKYWILIT